MVLEEGLLIKVLVILQMFLIYCLYCSKRQLRNRQSIFMNILQSVVLYDFFANCFSRQLFYTNCCSRHLLFQHRWLESDWSGLGGQDNQSGSQNHLFVEIHMGPPWFLVLGPLKTDVIKHARPKYDPFPKNWALPSLHGTCNEESWFSHKFSPMGGPIDLIPPNTVL